MIINAKHFSILAIVTTLAVLATGCADLAHKDQTKKLDQAVRAYIHAIRWGDYGAAASFIRPREGKGQPPDLAKLEGIKVTHYDYAIDSRARGDPEALMTAAFEYYHVDYRSVKKVYQQVLWWWDPQVENWFMDGSLPAFHEY